MCSQTARPVLYDAALVNAMIADVDRIDVTNIGSQAFHNSTVNNIDDEDEQLNAECKKYVTTKKYSQCNNIILTL